MAMPVLLMVLHMALHMVMVVQLMVQPMALNMVQNTVLHRAMRIQPSMPNTMRHSMATLTQGMVPITDRHMVMRVPVTEPVTVRAVSIPTKQSSAETRSEAYCFLKTS